MQGWLPELQAGRGSIKLRSVLEDTEQVAFARGEAWGRPSHPAALSPHELRASAAGAPGASASPAGAVRMGAISLCPGYMCPALHSTVTFP